MVKGSYFIVNCKHCKIEIRKRRDAYLRELKRHPYHCCKKCFGKEKSFRDNRSRVMTESNSFKGKNHTDEVKAKLSAGKKGVKAWNIGLTEDISSSVKKYSDSIRTRIKNTPGRYIGSGNPNWKGGYDSVLNPNRYPKPILSLWSAVRKEVIKRDCKKCCKCQSKKNIEVHHLLSRTRFPELQYDIDNLVLLCEVCHKQFHKKYGRKNFTPNNWVSWINLNRNPSEYFITC